MCSSIASNSACGGIPTPSSIRTNPMKRGISITPCHSSEVALSHNVEWVCSFSTSLIEDSPSTLGERSSMRCSEIACSTRGPRQVPYRSAVPSLWVPQTTGSGRPRSRRHLRPPRRRGSCRPRRGRLDVVLKNTDTWASVGGRSPLPSRVDPPDFPLVLLFPVVRCSTLFLVPCVVDVPCSPLLFVRAPSYSLFVSVKVSVLISS